MKYRNCDKCGKTSVPLNDSVKIDDEVYCAACFEENYSEKVLLDGKLIVYDFDATVCNTCGTDYGSVNLELLVGKPICDDCKVALQNKIFPQWVKGFLGLIIAIILFSFVYNWRFYTGYGCFKASFMAYAKGDFAEAEKLSREASDKVPESNDLKINHAYFNAIMLLSQDKSELALRELSICKDQMPDEFKVPMLIAEAAAGASFDKKDYESFLSASKELLQMDTTNYAAWGSVASAYSCLYVNKGQDSARALAYQYLNKAKLLDSAGKDTKEYANLIEYRIITRNIISRQDFNKKFPKGWTKN